MGKRRRAREQALKILFQVDVGGLSLKEVKETFMRDEQEAVKSFALSLAEGTLKNLAKIDKLIARFSQDWSLERLVNIDRNILRLAIYEMLYVDEIPVSVSINEAVELAKKYGTEESSKFINGLLGNLARRMELDKKRKVGP